MRWHNCYPPNNCYKRIVLLNPYSWIVDNP